jgi:hypothetical protein
MSKSCVTTFVHDNDGEVHTTVSTYGWDHDSVRDHRPRAVTTFRLGGVEVSVFTESIEVLHTIARAFEDTAAKLANEHAIVNRLRDTFAPEAHGFTIDTDQEPDEKGHTYTRV